MLPNLFTKVYERIREIHLYGFGGKGHQTDPTLNIGHQVNQEHEMWGKLERNCSGFHWHRPTGVDREFCKGEEPAPGERLGIVPLTKELVNRHKAPLIIMLLGDSTWRDFSVTQPKRVELNWRDPSWNKCSRFCPALLVNYALPGAALRHGKRRRSEKNIRSGLQHSNLEAPFIPVQVPFKGGVRSWKFNDNTTEAEEAVINTPGMLFTKPLVEIFRQCDWVDELHLSPDAELALVNHVCNEIAARELQPYVDTDVVPVIGILSDGWNNTFSTALEYSCYWRCRYDFGLCRSLKELGKWVDYYVENTPARSRTLDDNQVLPGNVTTIPRWWAKKKKK